MNRSPGCIKAFGLVQTKYNYNLPRKLSRMSPYDCWRPICWGMLSKAISLHFMVDTHIDEHVLGGRYCESRIVSPHITTLLSQQDIVMLPSTCGWQCQRLTGLELPPTSVRFRSFFRHLLISRLSPQTINTISQFLPGRHLAFLEQKTLHVLFFT